MSEYDSIRIETTGTIASLILNRPERLNSFSPDMIAELRHAAEALEKRSELRCLVLRAEGRGFCAGADLQARRSVAEGAAVDLEESLSSGLNKVAMSLRAMPFPVIASVQGVAAGAGVSLALSADICIAAEDARFLLAFSSIGLVPDGGATWLLPQMAGRAQALGKIMLGQGWSASEAFERGLIFSSVPAAELEAETQKLAEILAKRPTLALVAARHLIDSAASNNLEDQLLAEAKAQGACGNSADYRRGLRAFFAKEAAVFEGN